MYVETASNAGGAQTVTLNENHQILFVWHKEDARECVLRTTAHTVDSQRFENGTIQNNHFTDISVSGQFTTGNRFGQFGTTHWLAVCDDGSNDVEIFTYSGQASPPDPETMSLSNITGLLEWIMIGDLDSTPMRGKPYCTDTIANTDGAHGFGSTDAAYVTDEIESINTAGEFDVGTALNTSGVDYYAICIEQHASHTDSFEYAGDGNDNRDLSVVPSAPDWCYIARNDGVTLVGQRMASYASDTSTRFANAASGTNRIQDFGTGTVQVGNNAEVNASAEDYRIFVIETTPAAGPSATLLHFPDRQCHAGMQ